MMAATIFAIATHGMWGHLGASAMRASCAGRSGNAKVQIVWDIAPELVVVMDALMHASVMRQIDNYCDVNDAGHAMWLSSAWSAFNTLDDAGSSLDAAGPSPGQMEQFIEKLMHAEHAHVFVPTRALRQGTPSNPYIEQRARQGYHIDVEPTIVAQRLMMCREDMADDWCESLLGLAAGFEIERRPHMQRIVGLATHAAIRSTMHELAWLPSHAAAHDFLANCIAFNADALGPGGDADAFLADLGRMPICISDESIIVPQQIAAGVRMMRQKIASAMAETLARTSYAHQQAMVGFLDGCFAKADDGRASGGGSRDSPGDE